MTVRGSQEWARAAANRAERTRRASLAARRGTMSKEEEPKHASIPAAPGEGVSPNGLADMSAEDLQPTLAEGGAAVKALVEKAKTAPGSVFEPETLSVLAQLAKTKFPAWVNLRARLKSEARDVPIAELDKRVKPNGGDTSDGDDGLPGGPLKFGEIELWDERVDGANLLAELSSAIGAYVIMDPAQRVAVALWAVFTHAHDFFLCAALLIILSPTKRCGKTRLQEILAKLTPRPQTMSGVSAPLSLASSKSIARPSLLTNTTPPLAETGVWQRAFAGS
jgi:hypothetical protein